MTVAFIPTRYETSLTLDFPDVEELRLIAPTALRESTRIVSRSVQFGEDTLKGAWEININMKFFYSTANFNLSSTKLIISLTRYLDAISHDEIPVRVLESSCCNVITDGTVKQSVLNVSIAKNMAVSGTSILSHRVSKTIFNV